MKASWDFSISGVSARPIYQPMFVHIEVNRS